MTLIWGQEKHAIVDNFNYGPGYGHYGEGGHDLFIADKCNQNNKSYACFPSSYNNDSKYEKNQQSWTVFSGATNGFKFTVIDYEVFEVVK
jgi:hypothetical protein